MELTLALAEEILNRLETVTNGENSQDKKLSVRIDSFCFCVQINYFRDIKKFRKRKAICLKYEEEIP
jgi:hypothetical protein